MSINKLKHYKINTPWRAVVSAALLLFISIVAFAQGINQVGFRPESVKRAFFDGKWEGQAYHIINKEGATVFSGSLSQSGRWPHSGTEVCYAEFSALKVEGNYTLLLKGQKEALPFGIDQGIYRQLGKEVVQSFYHARVSMAIDEKHGGVYARPAGHPDAEIIIHASAASAERPAGSVISSPGGWYDAGDYNKYIVNSGISTYSLLHLVEQYGDHLAGIELNIPESGNGLPDVLNETLYNLRWMLTMQDPHDGGVYHKLTSKRFCGMKMPHNDPLERYVVMKSTAATLDFAATMAKASRLLQNYSKAVPGLADSCLTAAQTAWAWSEQHPDVLYKQPKDISTGEYKDSDISDEWFWAATELYLTTRNQKFLGKVDIDAEKFTLPQWGMVNTLGLYSIVSDKNKLNTKSAQKKLVRLADQYLKNYEQSAYRISIEKFPWGSNSELANQGILLMHSYMITEDTKYLEAADACVGYILGANPLHMCFMTGFGTQSPLHIHDRRSVADGIDAPVPGMMVGGPTKQARQDCGEDKYPSTFPAMSYLDMECSYATNEIAINWNAAAAYLILGLDAIYTTSN
ncbi:MAG: glycoside hydrolase family 9 protein [Marinilabiliaceae bacterium]|nr:glycoside hydrolase family 9 protein [Marinilabiliaceae bacterium]